MLISAALDKRWVAFELLGVKLGLMPRGLLALLVSVGLADWLC